MTICPEEVGTRLGQPSGETSGPARTAPSVAQLQIALLQCQVETLRRELKAERERRQAIVTRYEQLLDER